MVLQKLVDMITFPSPPSSYSLVSHRELFFVQHEETPVPCMLYSLRTGAPLLIVYCHSNGCDIGDMHAALHCVAASCRCHVMSFEFPGYGLYDGKSSMETIDTTCLTILDYIEKTLGVGLNQIVWYGRSIGTGPAINMANLCTVRGVEPAGLIVQCGFFNFKEVAGYLFGRVAKRLVAHKWDNENLIKRLSCAVLILHGRKDKMIPHEHAEKLWEAVQSKHIAHSKKILCHCGHNDFNFQKCTVRPVREFLHGVKKDFSGRNIPHLDIPQRCRPMVLHIGVLRQKMPVMVMKRYSIDQIERLTAHAASASRMTLSVPEAERDASPTAQRQTDQRLFDVGNRKILLRLTPPDDKRLCTLAFAEHGGPKSECVRESYPAYDRVALAHGRSVDRAYADVPGLDSQPFSAGKHSARKQVGFFGEEDAVDAEIDDAPLVSDNISLDFHALAPSKIHMGKRMTISGIKRKTDDGGKQDVKKHKGRRHCACADGHDREIEVCVVCYESQCEYYHNGIYPGDTNNLLSARSLVHLLTARMVTFLYALRDDLENEIESGSLNTDTPIEKAVEWVEAQFWLRSPFLNLYEELIWTNGQLSVQYVFGPYILKLPQWEIAEYDGKLSSAKAVRIPLWCYAPTAVHFRFITEWVMLSSSKLRAVVPDPTIKKSSKRMAEKLKEHSVAPDDFAAAFATHFGIWVSEPQNRAILEKIGTLCKRAQKDALASRDTVDQTTETKGLSYWLSSNGGALPLFRHFLDRANQSTAMQKFLTRAFEDPSQTPKFYSEEELLTLFSIPSKSVYTARNADYFVANTLHLLHLSPAHIGAPLIPVLNRSMQFAAKTFSTFKRERRKLTKSRPM